MEIVNFLLFFFLGYVIYLCSFYKELSCGEAVIKIILHYHINFWNQKLLSLDRRGYLHVWFFFFKLHSKPLGQAN